VGHDVDAREPEVRPGGPAGLPRTGGRGGRSRARPRRRARGGRTS
jgi:hypothetical protein